MSNDRHITGCVPGTQSGKLNSKYPILIIDDEYDICFLLGHILKQTQHPTTFASSLSEANEIIEHTKHFSFIFLDNHLPDGYGVNYIRQIKKAYPSCKVIMITAHDNQADRDHAKKEGADYFIGKPFSKELVLNTIKRLSA